MKRTQLAQHLSQYLSKGTFPSHTFLVGFDGFIDEIVQCVKERSNSISFQPMQTINDFAHRIIEARGKSTNLELVIQQKKLGGNAPILAEGLTQAGFSPILIAALGEKDIDPLFTPLCKKCKECTNLGAPGYSIAIEFQDGKLIFGKHESILKITLDEFKRHIREEKLIGYFNDCDSFVSVNWTMLISQTLIWEYLLTSILPKIEAKPRKMFVDLADPAKRSSQDILQAIKTLEQFKKYFQVTLGMNELEAIRVSKLFDKEKAPKADHHTKDELLKLCHFLLKQSNLDCIVLHATKYACAATESEEALVDGPYCEKPLLTTGGGDNFNAGFLVGQALKLTLSDSCLLAVATSGHYVRTGKSPTLQELISFLQQCDTTSKRSLS